jgi:hypothetical protein
MEFKSFEEFKAHEIEHQKYWREATRFSETQMLESYESYKLSLTSDEYLEPLDKAHNRYYGGIVGAIFK